MNSVETPQSRCHIGVARADVTPPVGIYNRMWGAALQDRATAVHRPLLATALWLAPLNGDSAAAQIILTIDHCLLDREEMSRLRQTAGASAGIDPRQVHICLSHTHGCGYLTRARASLPGGDLIAPTLDALAETCANLAAAAAKTARPGTLVYGSGSCSLAAHRDYWDTAIDESVCGFNPSGPTDQTLLIARLTDDEGRLLGTLVNYACHPTTLGWQNSAISPDFIGAMRELIERETKAPCLYLQGASGDLGPREGFVGDWSVADRNGRQVGYSALAEFESLPQPGTRFVYTGSVISGTRLGIWSHQPIAPEDLLRQAQFESRVVVLPLAYRRDLPSLAETEQRLADWHATGALALQSADDAQQRMARAQGEQLVRQRDRLASLPAGDAYPYRVTLLKLGGAVWVLVPGELYHEFQEALRARFRDVAVIVATMVGDWHPGYLPTAVSYDRNVYQAAIAALAAGSLEKLTGVVIDEIEQLLAQPA